MLETRGAKAINHFSAGESAEVPGTGQSDASCSFVLGESLFRMSLNLVFRATPTAYYELHYPANLNRGH